MGDYVRVQKQDASNALHNWDTASQQAAADFKAKAQAALAAFKNADWAGNDTAGKDFKEAIDVKAVTEALDYPRFNGPNGPLNGAAALDACVALGARARNAINRSLESDAMQETELKNAQAKMTKEA
jgi:hypothetical protein